MKFRQYATSTAVCLALAGTSGIANAAIPGIPGEALFAPVVITEGGQTGTIETYVSLFMPAQIGRDQIINVYSAPHVSGAGPWPVNQNVDPALIHWTLYDADSKYVTDNFCVVSKNDTTIWTTDLDLQGIQGDQDADGPGKYMNVCGPQLRIPAGYVLFQTYAGADGLDSNFAFAGDGLVWNDVFNGLWEVPVMPMADGADISELQEPRLYNEVIAAETYGDGTPLAQDPSRFAPILSGIRMNNADQVSKTFKTAMPISGPASGSQLSLHVHWFSDVNPDRNPSVFIYDDQEGPCSTRLKLPRELNLTMINHSCEGTIPTPGDWGPLTADCTRFDPTAATPVRATPIIDFLYPTPDQREFGISSYQLCNPLYWLDDTNSFPDYPGALEGTAVYEFDEEGEATTLPGFVNRASVQFSAIQTGWGGGQWGTAMAVDLGKFNVPAP